MLDQIVAGLFNLHCLGIAHSNIKPQNILLGENNQAKLADYAIREYHEKMKESKAERKLLLSSDIVNAMTCTEYYSSPEILWKRPHTKKCDI